MKISLNWVKEYTEIKLPPDELKERVSVSLTEVENIENFAEVYKDIVVGEVVDVSSHPSAKNLLVLKVDIGEKKVIVVVQDCPVKVGDKVPYLKPGLVVPETIGTGNEVIVEAAEIKGVKSEGMIPSGREIALNYDHTTVYTVPSEIKTGAKLDQSLKLVDPIMEIKNKALTHRPDTFCVVGIARELGAIQGTSFSAPSWLYDYENLKPCDVDNKLPINLENNASALCSRYMAVVIDGVKVQPSPIWMQIKLMKMGVHPVNNVVDVSNYLMLEVGQPNHAFDYDKVISKDPNFKDAANIQVRLARAGEKLTVIDGQVKELYDDTIVISDSVNPIGVAGVMGGKDTEISDDTKRIIFQVENLDMYNIRRTSMKLGIFSEAVTRFSKGLDPNLCEPVMYKGIEMMKELTGGVVASKVYDNYKEPEKGHFVSVSGDYIRQRTGINIKDSEIIKILKSLELGVKQDAKSGVLSVEVPTFRRDLNIPQDICEEIVRIYGYDKVNITLPSRDLRPVRRNMGIENRDRIKETLKVAGANEFYTYSFVGKELYESCGLSVENNHRVKNPLSPELEYMRSLVVPSLLEKIPQNLNYREEFACFEIAKINPVKTGKIDPKNLPDEPWHLGLVHTKSYYHAKKYLEALMDGLNVSDYVIVSPSQMDSKKLPGWISTAMKSYHPGRTALIMAKKKWVGIIGQLDFDTVEALALPQQVSAFEINVDDIDEYICALPGYKEPSKYPAVVHDFCFITDRDVPYSAICNAVINADPKGTIVRDVECMDIYLNSKKNTEKKTTLTVTMQSNDKTLDEKDVEKAREQIVNSVKKVVNGRLAE